MGKSLKYFTSLFLIVLLSLASNQLIADKKDDDDDKEDDKDKHERCKEKLDIENIDKMRFGDFAVTGSGNLTIDTQGVVSASGGIILLGGSTSAARFRVEGCPNIHYSIIFPEHTQLESGHNQMLLDSFISSAGSPGALNSHGKQELWVGATLHATPGQPPGKYRGEFRIEVVYD